jgi:hypothetical protein
VACLDGSVKRKEFRGAVTQDALEESGGGEVRCLSEATARKHGEAKAAPTERGGVNWATEVDSLTKQSEPLISMAVWCRTGVLGCTRWRMVRRYT